MASSNPASSPRHATSVAGDEPRMEDIEAEIAAAAMDPDAVRTALGALESAFAQRTAAALARAGPAPGLPIDLDPEEEDTEKEPVPGSEEWAKGVAEKILGLQRLLTSHGAAGGQTRTAPLDTPTRMSFHEPPNPSLAASKSPFGIGNSSGDGQPPSAPTVEEDPLRGPGDPWGKEGKPTGTTTSATFPSPLLSEKPDWMALYVKQMEVNQMLLNEVKDMKVQMANLSTAQASGRLLLDKANVFGEDMLKPIDRKVVPKPMKYSGDVSKFWIFKTSSRTTSTALTHDGKSCWKRSN